MDEKVNEIEDKYDDGFIMNGSNITKHFFKNPPTFST